MIELKLPSDSILNGCMDIKCARGLVFAIQNNAQYDGGRFVILDDKLNIVGEYAGIGNARQIEVVGDICYITARENGLWVFDVSSVTPRLVSRYMTVEYATGISVYSTFAFVSCRQYGVEIIDISVPEMPRFVNLIRVGEVQSSCVSDGVLFCGLWGEMAVCAVDISDLSQPKVLWHVELSGRGDGVVACKGLLYAVSGQHGRGIKNFSDENDAMYGMGNTFAVFDISDITAPRKIFEYSFGKAYDRSYDMWKPIIAGDVIACCDSVLGVYLFGSVSLEMLGHIECSCGDAVTSIASDNGVLYISTAKGGVFKIEGSSFKKSYRFDEVKSISCDVPRLELCVEGEIECKVHSFLDLPVSKVMEWGGFIFLCCGVEGLVVIDKHTSQIVHRIKMESFLVDIELSDKLLLCAFSDDGLFIYDLNGFNEMSNLRFSRSVQQLKLSANGRFVACCVGSTRVDLVDLADAFDPLIISSRVAQRGPLYGDNFCSNLLDDGSVVMFWHRDGIVYTNPENGIKDFKNIFYGKKNGFMAFGPESGCDTDGKSIFFSLDGGYVFLPLDECDADDLPRFGADNMLCGKFTVFDKFLVASERSKGMITVLDIENKFVTKRLGSIKTNATCYKPYACGGKVFVPLRNYGILEITVQG